MAIAGAKSKAMVDLDGVIQRNSASAEELASTAEELSGQAVQLRESVSFFRLGMDAQRGRQLDMSKTGVHGVRLENTASNDGHNQEYVA